MSEQNFKIKFEIFGVQRIANVKAKTLEEAKIKLKNDLILEFRQKPKMIKLPILSKYTNLGMNEVLEKYFVKESKNLMLNYKLKLTREEELALQYYMFLNKRYISSDCLSGFSYCYDFEVYRKELKLKQ
mgnify:CR=1 FL=1